MSEPLTGPLSTKEQQRHQTQHYNPSSLAAARSLLERETPELDLGLRLQALSIAESKVTERERAASVREEVFRRALDASGKDVFLGGRSQSDIEQWILSIVDSSVNNFSKKQANGGPEAEGPEGQNCAGFIEELEDWVLQVEAAHVENHRYEARLRYDAHRLQALDAELRIREERLATAESQHEAKVQAHERRLETTAFAVSQLDERASTLAAGERELARWMVEANQREQAERARREFVASIAVGDDLPMLSDEEFTARSLYGARHLEQQPPEPTTPHSGGGRGFELDPSLSMATVQGASQLVHRSRGVGGDQFEADDTQAQMMGVVADQTVADAYEDSEDGREKEREKEALVLKLRLSIEADLKEELSSEWDRLRAQQQDAVEIGQALKEKQSQLENQATYLKGRYNVLEDLALRWQQVHGNNRPTLAPSSSAPSRAQPSVGEQQPQSQSNANVVTVPPGTKPSTSPVQATVLSYPPSHLNITGGTATPLVGPLSRPASAPRTPQEQSLAVSTSSALVPENSLPIFMGPPGGASSSTVQQGEQVEQGGSGLHKQLSKTMEPSQVVAAPTQAIQPSVLPAGPSPGFLSLSSSGATPGMPTREASDEEKESQRRRLARFYAYYCPKAGLPVKTAQEIETSVQSFANPDDEKGGYETMWKTLESKYGPESQVSATTGPAPTLATAPSTASPEQEKEVQRKRLLRFYAYYCPLAKIPMKTDKEIDGSLQNFAQPDSGGFAKMWSTLEGKYGPEQQIILEEEQRQRLTRYYDYYCKLQGNPPKTPKEIDGAIERYRGSNMGGYAAMWKTLEQKYGPESALPKQQQPPTQQEQQLIALYIKYDLYAGERKKEENIRKLMSAVSSFFAGFVARLEERFGDLVTMQLTGEKPNYEQQLTAFYTHFEPSQKSEDYLGALKVWVGLEEEFLVVLENKYGKMPL